MVSVPQDSESQRRNHGASDPVLEQLPGLLDLLPHQLCLVDGEGHCLDGNAPLLSSLGMDVESLRRRRLRELVHAEDRDALDQAWTDALARQQPRTLDIRLRRADGRSLWQQLQLQALAQRTGRAPLWLCSFTDINERKAAEQQLRDADALWKLALESIGDGVWDWYVQSGVELFSERYLQMYGFAPGELEANPKAFDERTHPDDVAQMERDRQAHFEGKTALYTNEHRVRCKDGSWKWVLTRGIVISRDEQGRPLRMVGTHTDITERKAAEALIWHQARYDTLTGLPNRRLLRERLQEDLAQCMREHHSLAVLFIDLDHFKEVNDTLGHDAGDALLLQAAQRIRACLREGDIVARMGGDEFTVVLTDLQDLGLIERTAAALIESLSDAFQLGNDRAFVSASIGISVYPRDGLEIETLFKHADQALYVAKAAGRNRFSRFTPALQLAAQTRRRLTNDLREALQRDQFKLMYQPIVSLCDASVQRAEALLRWHHPRQGLVMPADFVSLAESSGLIMDIDGWVLEQAILQARRWRERLHPNFQISINRSPLQFRSGPERQAQWLQQLALAEVRNLGLAMEITEGLLLSGDLLARRQLQALREAGISIALDDFGTGYSSLASLQQHQIDCLKIDRSFVRPLNQDGRELALCRAIISLAHELGMSVVAEGVETEIQARLLTDIGCDYAQGYWFASPMDAAALERWLAQRGLPPSSSSVDDR